MSRLTTEQIGEKLKDLIKGEVLVDIFNRVALSTDASIYQIMPVCVTAPKDAEDISNIIKFAASNNIPIAGRGAGSGVAGEALTDGIVIDTCRNMKRIIGSNEDGSIVTCQPGVVLDDLNNYLSRFAKKIGPDPSSSNRAVIGGVVANNATGAHSLEYGYIANYIEEIEVVLANGDIVRFKNNVTPDDSDIARSCMEVLASKEQLINDSQPKTKRNRSGYNIVGICHDGRIDLAKLMASSEGTLGIFTEITLRTVNLPEHKALLQLEFESFEKMAKAVRLCIDTGASACELMDRTLLDMAIDALPQYKDILPKDCAATLLVEHTGEKIDDVTVKIELTDKSVGSLAKGRMLVIDQDQQKRLWKSRKDAVPLLHGEKGLRHPIGFIEDVSVDNNNLAEYVAGLDQICKRYNIPMAYYGHAGDGELHIRPFLDLTDPVDIQKMRDIANDVFELAWSLGGSISGEHADGLVRAAFIKRQYGDEYYELLKAIKNIFDPSGIMNPGKMINEDPDVMIKNLRAEHLVLPEHLKTNLLFEPDEFRFEIEQCNGDGVCVSTQAGTRMCPVFRAMGDELACSRAKANLLRAWITGIINKADFESPEFKKILGLCVNCKMCSVECPSGVDISKLMVEARAEYVKQKGLTRTEYILTHNRFLSIMGSAFAPLSNFIMNFPLFKLFLEKAAGLDKRRQMPKFLRGSFLKKGRRYLAEQPKITELIDKVAYFIDSYANYNDHELGFATIKTLLHNNIEVVLPDQRPVPIPAFVYGDLKTARKDLEYIVDKLAELVKSGYKIICSEPTAALCLREELRLIINSDDARLISANTYELMSYLNGLWDEGKIDTKINNIYANEKFAYHNPCHLCALGISGASIELLNKIAGLTITDINAGCCGLAGTCGMQKKNYDLSVDIGKEMTKALMEMDSRYAVTECGACKMQIEQLTDKQVIHPIKILAKIYGLI